MSMVRSITMDGKTFTFVCESWSTRHGFAHGCEMFGKGGYYKIAEEKCYYLNRTWECWTYQSAILGAVRNAIDYVAGRVREDLMERNNWQKITAKRKDELDNALENDAEYATLKKVYDNLKGYNPAWD